MREFNYKKRLKISCILIMLSIVLLIMAHFWRGFADWYFKYIYSILLNTFSRIFSLVPFSVYELVLYTFVIFIIYRIIKYIYLIIKRKISIKKAICQIGTNILLYIAIFFFLNIITQGVNCLKSSFVNLTGLEVQEPTEEKLIELCEYIQVNLNILDEKIEKDKDGVFTLGKDTNKIGIDNMKNLSKTYPCLSGFYPNPKGYIISKLMSYQLLKGESTFTIEANYNKDMPAYNIPSTICHELSHIQGFNNEDEANYISFLASINSKDYNYQYSAYLMAYEYCMSDLYDINENAFKEINSKLSENVKIELREDALFWRPYRGTVSKIYNFIYDKLLKMVGQENGIKSYNGVVKLLISGYKNQF